jgi:hypothetical protein
MTKETEMKIMTRRSMMAVLLLLMVGVLAGPMAAFAQSVDGDGYPLDVEGEVIVRDDVVVDGEAPPAPVSVPPAETEVLGVSLARTGLQVLLFAAVGGALLLLGGGALAASRTRRGQGDAGGTG